MASYTPAHEGTVTKYIVVESFDITPADLGIRAYEISKGAMIKETCFGLAINGAEDVVDRLIGKQEVVIKGLGNTFKQSRGLAGAAILGDGRVGLILDVNGLVTANQARPAHN